MLFFDNILHSPHVEEWHVKRDEVRFLHTPRGEGWHAKHDGVRFLHSPRGEGWHVKRDGVRGSVILLLKGRASSAPFVV